MDGNWVVPLWHPLLHLQNKLVLKALAHPREQRSKDDTAGEGAQGLEG